MEDELNKDTIGKKIGIRLQKAGKIVGQGINNNLWQVTDNEDNIYAFKIYKPTTKKDSRKRLDNEVNFLNHCKKCRCIKVPELVKASREGNWSLMKWIRGKKLEIIEEKDISQIIEFMYAINTKNVDERNQLEPAPDCLTYETNASKRLENRAKELEIIVKKNKHIYERDEYDWICNEILEESWKQIKIFDKQHANSDPWRKENIVQILSPSDVGIHNTIKNDNDLYFIDFEYAGLDDLAKLVSDWVMQPEYRLNKQQEDYMLKKLINCEIIKNRTWIDRYYSIKKITHLKWCLIMLKGTETMGKLEREKTICKTKRYFEEKI